MSRFSTLAQWLQWQEQLHPREIDLGLQRVYDVAIRLQLLQPPSSISHSYSGALASAGKTIAVAGTNGKGSCVATLQQLLSASGEKVGSYTSPHIHCYNERICVNGQPVSDEQLCSVFARIDDARGDISLTYFEFGTLAALAIFVQEQVSYSLLEVGLGGRLDAVNIVDADVSVITSIDLDHQQWLGDDRNAISVEKLGIARCGHPLVIAEERLTDALALAVESYPTQLIGRDFSFQKTTAETWQFSSQGNQLTLPPPKLPSNSVAAALACLEVLNALPDAQTLSTTLNGLHLAGRFEVHTVNGVNIILDVAHNPAAAQVLADRLKQLPAKGQRLAIMAVMMDKTIDGIIAPLSDWADQWFVGGLPDIPRAASADEMTKTLLAAQLNVEQSVDVVTAFTQALSIARAGDNIVVFGSFYTVSAVRQWLLDNLLRS